MQTIIPRLFVTTNGRLLGSQLNLEQTSFTVDDIGGFFGVHQKVWSN